jgi:hypothetical protein
MRKLKLALMMAALLIATHAFAHEAKGPNGGRVIDAGNYHVELVVGGTDVAVFVSDGDNRPIAPAGFKALAILNAGGKAQRIALSPAEGKLAGRAETTLPASVKGVVQLTSPDGKVAQGQLK